jgi:hypothetical protein
MHKYFKRYECGSDERAKTFKLILGMNLLLLKFLLIFAKLAIL